MEVDNDDSFSYEPFNVKECGWFERQKLSWWFRLTIWIIKLGPIPRHVAFIMDGNRRYARAHNCSTVLEGHELGFKQLTKVLDWCDYVGIKEVTVYAFSIENFKRSESEVKGLMELAEHKFSQLLDLLQKSEQSATHQVCIRFFGNLQMLPEKIRSLITQIEEITRNKGQSTFLNICLAYTSSNELFRAVEGALQKIQCDQHERINNNDYACVVDECMDTYKCIPLDMFRPFTYLHFEENVLWPEFSLWHLLKSIIAFQVSRFEIIKMKANISTKKHQWYKFSELFALTSSN
uniref:Alkyl transferase n=1 Tax=Meloidogyne hapla TaxID=6305 RepID=A0A1I8B7K7_MELHA